MAAIPITEGDKERWRQALEHLGPDLVQQKLLHAIYDPGGRHFVPGIVGGGSAPPLKFVEDWLAKKRALIERRNSQRYWLALGIAVLTLAAAVTAAWPVLFGRR